VVSSIFARAQRSANSLQLFFFLCLSITFFPKFVPLLTRAFYLLSVVTTPVLPRLFFFQPLWATCRPFSSEVKFDMDAFGPFCPPALFFLCWNVCCRWLRLVLCIKGGAAAICVHCHCLKLPPLSEPVPRRSAPPFPTPPPFCVLLLVVIFRALASCWQFLGFGRSCMFDELDYLFDRFLPILVHVHL